MSVLIKDMEKPKSCVRMVDGEHEMCPFVNTDDDCVLQLGRHCYGTWDDQYAGCPLLELPEKHGRLIDENDVIDAIYERLRELQTHKEFIKKRGDIDLLGVLYYISKIQAVIEAEGE